MPEPAEEAAALSGKEEQQRPRPQASKVTPAPQQQREQAQAVSTSRGSSGGALVAGAAATAAAATALFFLLRHLRQRRNNSNRVQRSDVGKNQVFSAVLGLREPSAPLPPPAGPGMAGITFVVSDRLDVQSLETRFGCDPWKNGRAPAAQMYWPADALVAAGARGTAVVLGAPLGLGPLLPLDGAGTPNPAGCGRTHGGGEYGAAVAVAAGLSELALAVDELGSARVPAACCGAYALRTTAGTLPLEGASTASHSLAAPALLASDPAVLLRAGQALRLPGGGAPTTEVLNYLVAEDFFAACGEEARRMVPAVVAAVKRWAGPEQAQALSLCEWLFNRVDALVPFLPLGLDAGPAGRKQRSDAVLQALAAVAEAIQQWEFVQKHGPWVEGHQAELAASVVDYWRRAQQVDEGRYRQAQAAAQELQEAMRAALVDGYVFVLPTTPGPAPPAAAGTAGAAAAAGSGGKDGSDSSATDAYQERCLQFAAVAALSGVPQVVLPLPVPGGMPLSVSLLALHKKDQALLQAAAKLGPMLAEEAATLAEQLKQERRHAKGSSSEAQPRWRPAVEAAEVAKASGSQPGRAGSNGKRKQDPAATAAMEAADARKEEGNTAFRAGRYDEAARQYSAAIQLHPRAAVYYANRAMAYLKLGSYGAAESDCDEALKLELSAKALLRRGSARLAQGNAAGAAADFRQVLALEPQNRQAREELRGIEAAEQQLQLGAFG